MNNFKSYELKIKARSLALEGQLIHQNEIHLKRQITRCKAKIIEAVANSDSAFAAKCRDTLTQLRADRDSLREHRKEIRHKYSRNAHLAYGFLKGRSLKEMEPKRYTDPDWSAIMKMIDKYGARAGIAQERAQSFERWKQEAGEKAVPDNRPRAERKAEKMTSPK